VKTIWTGKVAQAAARYGEHAPMAGACCNVCRTCATTNVIGLAVGGAAAAAAAVTGLARRRGVTRASSS
jgi:hypothetical protein